MVYSNPEPVLVREDGPSVPTSTDIIMMSDAGAAHGLRHVILRYSTSRRRLARPHLSVDRAR